MTHEHTMEMVEGKVRAVYADGDDRYIIVDGERLNWCPLCGEYHAEDDGTPGYSCQ